MGQIYINSSNGDLVYKGTLRDGVLADGYGQVPLTPLTIHYPGVTGVKTTNSGSADWEGIGCITFDPSDLFDGNNDLTRTILFQAVLEASPGVTAAIRLYNLTTGAVVTSSTLNTSSNTPTTVSGTLIVGSSPNLPNSEQIYEIQLQISSPSSPTVSDQAICKSASILVNWQ